MNRSYSNVSGPREKEKSFLTFTLAFTGSSCPWWLMANNEGWLPIGRGSCLQHLFNRSTYKACQNRTQHRSKWKICIHWVNSKMSLCWKASGRVCCAANTARWNKRKTTAVPSEPRVILKKKPHSQQGRSWNVAYLLIHSVELSD